MKYRSDIDGLRAVAVLSVVAYHYFPPVLHGGFIGVDIFFVISGYLISSVIFSEIDNNNFSILKFYRRRINRIFPALACVLVASLIIGWFTLFSDEYKSLGQNALASAAFLENIYLWNQTGYFDLDSAKKPLLHIWSLGVEEQFYIIYPVILLSARKIGFLNFRFLLICLIISLIASIITIRHSMAADFYMPITRYWELSVGGILAWHERSGATWSPLRWKWRAGLPLIASCLGMLAVLSGFIFINAATPFPGLAALLPVLGAALIIGAGPLAPPNRILLSNRIAVFIGKTSYPLYLWHWPLLAFLFIVNLDKPEPPVRLVLVAIAFVLAILTWLLVETPIRKHHNNSRTAIILLVIMVLIGALGLAISLNAGLSWRTVNVINAGATVRTSGIDSPPLPVHDCGAPADIAKQFRNCLGDHNGEAHFVLLGDSKADALYHGLASSALPGNDWLYLGGADATSFGAPTPMLSANQAWSSMQHQSQAAITYIVGNPKIRVVVYAVALRNVYQLDDNGGAGRLFNAFDPNFLGRLKNTALEAPARAAVMAGVDRLVTAGVTVAILVDNPPLPPLRSCNGRLTALAPLNRALDLKSKSTSGACRYAKEKFRSDAKIYFDMLSSVKQKYGEKFLILDYTDFYCRQDGGNTCGTAIDGNAIYGYTDHISSYTAAAVGKSINARLRAFSGRNRLSTE